MTKGVNVMGKAFVFATVLLTYMQSITSFYNSVISVTAQVEMFHPITSVHASSLSTKLLFMMSLKNVIECWGIGQDSSANNRFWRKAQKIIIIIMWNIFWLSFCHMDLFLPLCLGNICMKAYACACRSFCDSICEHKSFEYILITQWI